MWDNPLGRKAANRKNTGGEFALDNHGEAIWETICFFGSGEGETFTLDSIVNALMMEKKLARRTAYNYVCIFLGYAKAAAEEFSGPKSKITRVKRGVYCLEDNPIS